MKKFWLILILIAFVGCSQQSENTTTTKPPTTSDSDPLLIDIGKLQDKTGLLLSNAKVDFGLTNNSTQKVSKVITIKNTGSMAANMNIVPLGSNTGFSIIKNSLCGSTLNSQAQCSLTIQFSNVNLYNANYNDGLIVTVGSSGIAVQFTAQVTGNPYNGSIGTDKINLNLDAPFNLRGNNYRTLNVSNAGQAYSNNLDQQIPSDYTIRVNRCATLLLASQSCSMQIMYDSNLTDPPSGTAVIASSSSATSINLLTGVVTYSNNDTIFSAMFSNPLLINHQNGFTLIHYQKNINYIKRTDYKMIIMGD